MTSRSKHTGKLVAEKDGVKIIDCKTCGFRHVEPLPTMDDIMEFYGRDYYEEIKPEMLTNYKESLDWFNQMYDDRFITFKELLGGIGRVLDIGAGAGYFLKRARENNWDYYGIEASKAACNYAEKYNNINIENNFFENVVIDNIGYFDAINMSEVLEHVVNPRLILEKCHKILRRESILFLMVPNEFNDLQLASKKLYPEYADYWVVPDHHYNYFTKDTIIKLLRSTGFEVFKVEASFPIEWLLIAGDNYLEDRDISRVFYNKIKRIELTLVDNGLRQLKRKIYEKFAEIEIGRDLMLYARKV